MKNASNPYIFKKEIRKLEPKENCSDLCESFDSNLDIFI